jgi:uncharacterized membrane protein
MKLNFKLMLEEGKKLGIVLLIGVLLLKIVFFKELLLTVIKMVLSLLWLFFPGFVFMLRWKEKLGFVERFLIGVGVSTGVLGIASYYVGIMGLHVKYHGAVLPLVFILLAFVFVSFSEKEGKSHGNDEGNEDR